MDLASQGQAAHPILDLNVKRQGKIVRPIEGSRSQNAAATSRPRHVMAGRGDTAGPKLVQSGSQKLQTLQGCSLNLDSCVAGKERESPT